MRTAYNVISKNACNFCAIEFEFHHSLCSVLLLVQVKCMRMHPRPVGVLVLDPVVSWLSCSFRYRTNCKEKDRADSLCKARFWVYSDSDLGLYNRSPCIIVVVVVVVLYVRVGTDGTNFNTYGASNGTSYCTSAVATMMCTDSDLLACHIDGTSSNCKTALHFSARVHKRTNQ
jgi:hypothetical protein